MNFLVLWNSYSEFQGGLSGVHSFSKVLFILLTILHFKKQKKKKNETALATAFFDHGSLQDNDFSSYHHHRTFTGRIFT